MSFTNPLGLLFLLAWLPVIALHVLKPRRVDTIVSSRLLWPGGTAGATAATPWQRLVPSWQFLLQMLAVGLIALALANPVTRTETGLSPHTVVVLDTSASMGAIDASPNRLAAAQAEALALWDELPSGARISLVVAGPTPRVRLTSSTDRGAYEAAVNAVRLSDGPADIAGAMALADGLETPEQSVGIVLVSDGRHRTDDLIGLPLGVTHRQIGSENTNRAITNLAVVPTDEGMAATATIKAFGGPESTAPLRFDVDGRTEAIVDVTVSPGEDAFVSVTLPPGEQIIARLGGEDLLAVDNTAYALARQRREVNVAVEGEAGPFVTALLESMAGVTVVDPTVAPADVIMFVGVPVPEDVSRPFIAVAPPGGVPGITVEGSVDRPIPTLVRSNHPLLVGLDMSSLRVASAQQVSAPTAETLIGAEGAPLMLEGRRAGLPFIYLTFSLNRSTLPLDVSFPVVGERMISSLAGAGGVPVALDVGTSLAPPAGRAAVVTDPVGNERELAAGGGSIVLDRPGFWTVIPEDGAVRTVAVALPTAESNVGPLPVAPTEPRPLRAGEDRPAVENSWRWLAIVAVLALAALEWFLARRRVGVPMRQWRMASGLRLAGIALAILALLGVSLPRSSESVATVFVLDRSDSVGSSGRSFGLDSVSIAQSVAPKDAELGVVVFGDGARVERLLSPADASTGLQATTIDTERTDLAAGLRLAGAVLPDDSRRRVVIVSDGRATSGDADIEAANLGERGVAVDYILLDNAVTADASVDSLSAPGRIEEGEALAITATIRSTAAQDGLVTLRRDGEILSVNEVALNAGLTTVTLRDPAPDGGGLKSYDVTVEVALDDRPQNDNARTTVEVSGPSGVLVVDGSGGDAAPIANALSASGLVVETIPVAQLQGLDQIAGFDGVVLVDVDAADLSDTQMTGLVSATRDLGRGLVTIGGVQSYGMGAYRNSELESVLPVLSDILDSERRRTVAEVLAIDTSESMGECHCADGFAGPARDNGGVNKTEIARTGAARAIDSLSSTDEIGVLAIDTEAEWVIPLQQIPSDEIVRSGLSQLTPSGGTNLRESLSTAAESLRESDAGLKHIILFSDGFTEPGTLIDLAQEAGDLFVNEGITVSVVATGEGAANDLEPIAKAGGGRFYPGRDLTRIPEILIQEATIASRSFITEGDFLPTVTSASPLVRNLTASPPLMGYVATTAQPTARTLLTIGEEGDPLLATWQVGLGRSTAWTSDSGLRWSSNWASWDGYVEFWSRIVRDTFSVDNGGSLRATVDGDELRIRAELPSTEGLDEATAEAMARGIVEAQLTDPNGTQRTVTLRAVSETVFEAIVNIDEAGSYAIGGLVETENGSISIGSDLASKSYAAEYQPGLADEGALVRISELSGGRGEISASEAFEEGTLLPGTREVPLARWFLLAAGLAWLAAIVLSRLWLGGRSAVAASAATATAAPLVNRDGEERNFAARLTRNKEDRASGVTVDLGTATSTTPEAAPAPEAAEEAVPSSKAKVVPPRPRKEAGQSRPPRPGEAWNVPTTAPAPAPAQPPGPLPAPATTPPVAPAAPLPVTSPEPAAPPAAPASAPAPQAPSPQAPSAPSAVPQPPARRPIVPAPPAAPVGPPQSNPLSATPPPAQPGLIPVPPPPARRGQPEDTGDAVSSNLDKLLKSKRDKKDK